MRAKYPGTCKACKAAIKVGDEIELTPFPPPPGSYVPSGYLHAACITPDLQAQAQAAWEEHRRYQKDQAQKKALREKAERLVTRGPVVVFRGGSIIDGYITCITHNPDDTFTITIHPRFPDMGGDQTLTVRRIDIARRRDMYECYPAGDWDYDEAVKP